LDLIDIDHSKSIIRSKQLKKFFQKFVKLHQSQSKNKILYLESLRGFAATFVALYHIRISSALTDNAFINNSGLFVDFFFVLSGLVIALNYQHKLNDISKIWTFQFKRFLRLYPLHLLMLFAFLLIEFLKFISINELSVTLNSPPFSTNNLSSFIQNIFLTQSILSDTETWNTVSWSISTEFYTYIIFSLVCLFFNRSFLLIVCASLLIVFYAFFSLIYEVVPIFSMNMTRCLLGFFIGVLIFNLSASPTQGLGEKFSFPSIVPYFALVLTILAIIYADWFGVYVTIIFGIFIFTLLNSSPLLEIKRLLSWQPLVYLGSISYGIYMIHPLIWFFIHNTLTYVFKYPLLETDQIVIGQSILANMIIIFGGFLVLIAAHLSYKYFELPIMHKNQKQK
tara:strand:- start:1149 stop:2333 length:1185 start_codon:yes stop_codon:yes gene_type:complete